MSNVFDMLEAEFFFEDISMDTGVSVEDIYALIDEMDDE
jgi:hypothetical protein